MNEKYIGFFVSDDLRKRIRVFCAMNDKQMNEFYREAIEEKLARPV